jgi:hypothetical protein
MLRATSRILFTWLTILCAVVSLSTSAFAQFYPRYNVPHYHDAAGHRIDAAGHHIDLYGRHTGAVGVYDNGAISRPSYYNNYGFNNGYYGGSNGFSGYPIYSSAPTTAVIQNPSQYQSVVINRAPQNVIPGATAAFPAGGKIRILNPVGTGGEVRYSLNDAEYSIKEGYTQAFDNDRVWTIHFGSGGQRGDIRYTLSPGTYKFQVDQSGWELVRAADQHEYLKNASPSLAPAPTPQPDLVNPGLPPSPQ